MPVAVATAIVVFTVFKVFYFQFACDEASASCKSIISMPIRKYGKHVCL